MMTFASCSPSYLFYEQMGLEKNQPGAATEVSSVDTSCQLAESNCTPGGPTFQID
jgi:hypothetical protein